LSEHDLSEKPGSGFRHHAVRPGLRYKKDVTPQTAHAGGAGGVTAGRSAFSRNLWDFAC
jgi:hypothetical protein